MKSAGFTLQIAEETVLNSYSFIKCDTLSKCLKINSFFKKKFMEKVINDYLTKQYMIHFAIFSGSWKNPRYFCYELLDVVISFYITGDTSQTRISKYLL